MNAFLFGLIFLIGISSVGCTQQRPVIEQPSRSRLPLPTKDEVALVEGTPLTLTQFTTIRAALHQPTAETAYWVGVSSLVLEKAAQKHGKPMSLLDATTISRYAIQDLTEKEAAEALKKYPFKGPISSPDDLRKSIDQITSHTEIQRGLYPVSQLN